MNDKDHPRLVRLALDALTGPSASFWRPLRDRLLETCMLPDTRALSLLRGEDGPWRRFFPRRRPRFNFEKQPRDPRSVFPDTGFYLTRIHRHLRAGEAEEAARFAGVLSHYLGDFAQPAHYYELDLPLLLPPPAALANPNPHPWIEGVEAPVSRLDHDPALLGTGTAETRFRLEGRLAAVHALAVGAVLPMAQALYRGDRAGAAEAYRPVFTATAALLCDLLHTARVVATGEADAASRGALAECDLRLVPPRRYDVEMNYGQRPLVDRITLDPAKGAVPFRLLRKRGGGLRRERLPGLCPIPRALPLPGTELMSEAEYDLPRNVFDRFRARVGLLARHEPQARCVFEVWVDNELRWRGEETGPEEEAKDIDVPLGTGRCLTFRVRTDGSTDRLAYPIWGRPRLVKASP